MRNIVSWEHVLSGVLGSVLGAIIEEENREDNMAELLVSVLSRTVDGVYIHDIHNIGTAFERSVACTRGECIQLDTMSSGVGSR